MTQHIASLPTVPEQVTYVCSPTSYADEHIPQINQQLTTVYNQVPTTLIIKGSFDDSPHPSAVGNWQLAYDKCY